MVGLWALLVAGLMVSRLPTLSFKTVRVRPQFIAPLLVLVGLGAAVLITAPFLGLAVVTAVYLLMIPYSFFLHRWLARHPEAWDVPVRERRAVARAARANRRLGLRPPLRRRVAGRASAMARAVRRFGDDTARRDAPPPRHRASTRPGAAAVPGQPAAAGPASGAPPLTRGRRAPRRRSSGPLGPRRPTDVLARRAARDSVRA